jgi:hypothetical protein
MKEERIWTGDNTSCGKTQLWNVCRSQTVQHRADLTLSIHSRALLPQESPFDVASNLVQEFFSSVLLPSPGVSGSKGEEHLWGLQQREMRGATALLILLGSLASSNAFHIADQQLFVRQAVVSEH